MRLICPNCDAQYEVAGDIIPRDGRDVQCSNCGKTWYQHHPDHMPEVGEAADDGGSRDTLSAGETHVDAPDGPKRREIDASVTDILRQEAELETTARAHASEGLESQPELGLQSPESDVERRARETRDRMARMRGEEPQGSGAEVAAGAAVIGSRRDLLPDIEEINSTLRSTSDRHNGGPEETAEDTAASPKRRRSGFKRGFFLMVLLVLALIAIYVFAPQIAQAMPQVDPYLSDYVTKVDALRAWLDSKVISLLTWLDATASAQSN